MKKNIKRYISFALMLTMLFALCVPALADGKKYEMYDNYMCFGDSIAAGCALTRDGSETYFDQETDDYLTVYNNEYIYIGYDFSSAPKAYHSLVANELGANLMQYARSGMRAVEFRYILEGVYNDFDETRFWGNTYFDSDGNGFSLEDLDALNAYVKYQEQIKKADLMSVNIGSNDVFSFTLNMVLREMTADSSDPRLEKIKEFLNQGGDLGVAFGKLVEASESMGTISKLISVMSECFYKSINQFEENYEAVMKKVYEINPEITIVAVGIYNPLRDFRLSGDNDLDLSSLAISVVNQVNGIIKGLAKTYDNYYYADVVGTETYRQNYDDRYFWQYFGLKVHPTIAGHEFMAQQILNALPERAKLPFTDVADDAWYNDDVYYVYKHGLMNGVTDTLFYPNSTGTRAQVVTVLYRMSGSPSVDGYTENFEDVPDDYWCRDAIIWGYNNGIIKGFSDTCFAPTKTVTRAQLVTMLYRYAGSPEVSGELDMFIDSDTIAEPYRTAAVWAVENSIIQGYNDGSFMPNQPVSRAQLAVILARYDRSL